MVVGSALEDARHLAQRYDKVRQEAESQVTTGVERDTLYIMNSCPPFLTFGCMIIQMKSEPFLDSSYIIAILLIKNRCLNFFF